MGLDTGLTFEDTEAEDRRARHAEQQKKVYIDLHAQDKRSKQKSAGLSRPRALKALAPFSGRRLLPLGCNIQFWRYSSTEPLARDVLTQFCARSKLHVRPSAPLGGMVDARAI